MIVFGEILSPTIPKKISYCSRLLIKNFIVLKSAYGRNNIIVDTPSYDDYNEYFMISFNGISEPRKVFPDHCYFLYEGPDVDRSLFGYNFSKYVSTDNNGRIVINNICAYYGDVSMYVEQNETCDDIKIIFDKINTHKNVRNTNTSLGTKITRGKRALII